MSENEVDLFKKYISKGEIEKAIEVADFLDLKNKVRQDLPYIVIADWYRNKGYELKAAEFYKKAISINPNNCMTYNAIASMYFNVKDFISAGYYYSKTLELEPENVHALCDMGVIEKTNGNYQKAWENYEKVLQTDGESAVINTNIGVLLCEQGEYEKGMEYYKKAMRMNPNSQKIKFNYALGLLMLGELEEGFKHYENREWVVDKPPGNEWKGEQNENIMIVSEQGFGDIIQFSRFIPAVNKISKKVTLLCPKELVELMKTLEGVDEVLEFNSCDAFEEVKEESQDTFTLPYSYYIRVMSLPNLLGLDDISKTNYLSVDKNKFEYWQNKIKNNGRLRVGLSWQGAKRHNDPISMAIEKRRSIDLNLFEPIISLDNIDFYSLQKDDSFGVRKYPKIKDYMPEVLDFSETAAIIQNLDLVISVDTAVAHLAGVLNKPVWLLSRKSGCWRWKDKAEDTVWYPSMKIFRQTQDEWQSVIECVADQLKIYEQNSHNNIQG